MRWYACTRWHTEDIAVRFRDFIKERDQAYAAAAKARAKQERAAAAGVAALRVAEDERVQRLFQAVAAIFAQGLQQELGKAAAGKAVGG
eukprot:828984-Rhodomonas_salina.1